jgi:hypothetical protein
MPSVHAFAFGTTGRRQQLLGSYGLTVCAFLSGLFGRRGRQDQQGAL